MRQYFNISECILLIGKDQVNTGLGAIITNMGGFIYKLVEVIGYGYFPKNTTFFIAYPKER